MGTCVVCAEAVCVVEQSMGAAIGGHGSLMFLLYGGRGCGCRCLHCEVKVSSFLVITSSRSSIWLLRVPPGLLLALMDHNCDLHLSPYTARAACWSFIDRREEWKFLIQGGHEVKYYFNETH